MSQLRQKIETATNVTVIVATLLVAFSFVRAYIAERHRTQAEDAPTIGSQLPSIPGYDWSAHDRTLVLALKHGCHFCENSIPFYKRLITLSQSRQVEGLAAIFPDEPQQVADEVQAGGLEGLPVFSGLALNAFSVTGTPTLILVDRRGRVLKDWVGQLTSSEEQEVIAALTPVKRQQHGAVGTEVTGPSTSKQ